MLPCLFFSETTMPKQMLCLVLVVHLTAIMALPQTQLSNHMTVNDQSIRDKRLMGIFRCNGWGPGCTHFNDPVQSTGAKTLSKSSRSSYPRERGGRYGSSRRRENVFEPVFTLTSGE